MTTSDRRLTFQFRTPGAAIMAAAEERLLASFWQGV